MSEELHCPNCGVLACDNSKNTSIVSHTGYHMLLCTNCGIVYDPEVASEYEGD